MSQQHKRLMILSLLLLFLFLVFLSVTKNKKHVLVFSHLGPMVGAVTSNSATIWFRVEPQAEVSIQYSLDVNFQNHFETQHSVQTSSEQDYTGQLHLTGLSGGTKYYYRILINGEITNTSEVSAQFKTFPELADQVRIGLLADLSGKHKAPGLNELARDEPNFVVILGDWDHRDPKSLPKMRAMHRGLRGGETKPGRTFYSQILNRFPTARVWDDHDFGVNNSDKTFPGKQDALQAHFEYWPTYNCPHPEQGIWHRFNYGQLVEVFMLDLRSQRDPIYSGSPDDPKKSMLDGDASEGAPERQKTWLKRRLLESTAMWKILISSVTWNPTNEKDDAWWSFQAEQTELLEFIKKNQISGVFLISADIHSGGAIDDGTNSQIPEMSVPSVNLPEQHQSTCRARGASVTSPRIDVSCGQWSEGLIPHSTGYGLIDITGALAELKTMDQDGNLGLAIQLKP